MNEILQQAVTIINMYAAAKDRHGRYTYCNEQVAKAIGLDSPTQIIGKTDYDFCWRDQAGLYISGDLKAMMGNPLINSIEPQNQIDGFKKVLVSKSAMFNKHNQCIGTVNSYIDVTNYFIKKNSFDLKIDDKRRIYLGELFNNEYLTYRQAQVLKLLLSGMSAKQIATILGIKPKTAISHIEDLKLKLQCNTTGDIIMTSFKTDLNLSILAIDGLIIENTAHHNTLQQSLKNKSKTH